MSGSLGSAGNLCFNKPPPGTERQAEIREDYSRIVNVPTDHWGILAKVQVLTSAFLTGSQVRSRLLV